MNWKQDLQLRDLSQTQPIEVTCRICNHGRNEWPEQLLKNPDWAYFYLDELEHHLKCVQRGCNGSVRITLPKQGETEPFVGGMA